jgi:hypothetical protein
MRLTSITFIRFSSRAITAALLLGTTACMAEEAACENVKINIQKITKPTAIEAKEVLKDLEKLILGNESCAKNILGKLYYRGDFLGRDIDRAHEIFYDLTQRGYPPAAFNLVYLSIKEKKESPEFIVEFLNGLMINYLGDRQWGYISAGARDLAGDYLDELNASSILSQDKIKIMREEHQKLSIKTTTHLAEMVKARTSDLRGQSDAIMGILALGVAASAISQRNILARQQTFRPSFQSQPFAPRLYSVVPMGSPNLIYLIPH